jgi:hypothetical protein
VARDLQGLPTERAGGPAGSDDRGRAPDEVSRAGGLDADAEQVRTTWLCVEDLSKLALDAEWLSLDHDLGRRRVPGQGHRPYPKQLDRGLLERAIVASHPGRQLAGHPLDRVEQLRHAAGERGDLRLLQPDTHQRTALARLQVERPRTGLPDSAGHETVRRIEVEDAASHTVIVSGIVFARVGASMANRMRAARFGLGRGRRSQRPSQARPMAAERHGGPGPRARTWLGWAAAALGVAVVAFLVGRAGSEAGLPSPTPSPSATGPLPITFGTALDAASGDAIQTTNRFRGGDLFAYSVRMTAAPGIDKIEVEIIRLNADATQTVAQPRSKGEQGIDATSRVFAFKVQTSALLDAWGPGDYAMRIYLPGGADPIATGRFTLVETPVAS